MKRKGRGGEEKTGQPSQVDKLNARQKRRLAKLKEKDEKKKKRQELFHSLTRSMLTPDQMKLLRASSEIGKRESKKEKLGRAFREQKALGFVLTNEVELEKPVKRKRDTTDDELDVVSSAKTTDDNEATTKAPSPSVSSAPPPTPRFDFTALGNKTQLVSPELVVSEATAVAAVQQAAAPPSEEAPATSLSVPAAAPEPQRARKRRKKNKKKASKKLTQEPMSTVAPEPSSQTPDDAEQHTVADAPAVQRPTPDALQLNMLKQVDPTGAPPTSATEEKKASRPAFFVPVNRLSEVEEQRSKLPIFMEEQRIMEAIKENEVVVICGETGSGKTTQVPQFLYEAGFGCPGSANPGMVAVTQPRRVAAVSMAQRVSHELNVEKTSIVSYQIRYDSTVSKDTRIKFMTDGILLKEIQSDFLMKRYSVIIIDEAHERNLNTDILIGLLSRIVPMRAQLACESEKKFKQNPSAQDVVTPLKLVIMSATLRVSDFVDNPKLFAQPPPVISVDARQFPVTVHFNRRTVIGDYIGEAFKKICKIHQRLPLGGVLVFLTGQQEIEVLCRKLRAAFPPNMKRKKKDLSVIAKSQEEEKKEDKKVETTERTTNERREAHVEQTERIGEKGEGEGEGEKEKKGEEADEEETIGPLWVLPLYSALPTRQQLRVFEPCPKGYRMVVVATNVAETSLTIPGIKYVVDSGRTKERVYERASGMSSYVVQWESQASANQRAGRAGRIGPGHCYRLFSSSVFNDHFPQFSDPEITRIPIEGTLYRRYTGVVLQMKNMGIDKVVSFPFPTPPDRLGLKEAHRTLSYLGALNKDERLTPIGRSLANFPVAPRYAKMLVLGHQGGCLPYVIALVAALSVGDPLLRQPLINEKEEEEGEEKSQEEKKAEEEEKERRKKRRAAIRSIHSIWAHPTSDLLVILRAIGAFEYGGASEKFAETHFLDYKVMREIHQMREQLTYLVNTVYPQQQPLSLDSNLHPPTPDQELLLRQVITAGLIDQVARLNTERSEMGYVNEGKADKHFQYLTVKTNETVYIHPSSFLFGQHEEYVAYSDLVLTKKMYMRGVTAIHPSWLCSLGTSLCSFSKPLEIPPPRYDPGLDSIRCFVSPTYGPNGWTLPVYEVDMEDGINRYKYFMRFLLEGNIIPSLKALREKLSGRPSMITTPSSTQHKTLAFLQTLARNKIYNKKTLLEKLKAQPKFLLPEMKLWVNLQNHQVLEETWQQVGQKPLP